MKALPPHQSELKTGTWNIPEYDINKSVKQLAAAINTEAEKFDGKYEQSNEVMYEAYRDRLWSIAEQLERFVKMYKEDNPI